MGGDFYDAFEIGDGEWTVALGDVVGKGPDAAALMGMVRHTIRAAAIRERAPARVLATVNAAVGRQTSEEQFCTAVAARLRPQGDQVIGLDLAWRVIRLPWSSGRRFPGSRQPEHSSGSSTTRSSPRTSSGSPPATR